MSLLPSWPRGEWVRVIDISTPSAPLEIAAYKTPSHATDIWVAGDTAYVAANQAGLMMFGLEANDQSASRSSTRSQAPSGAPLALLVSKNATAEQP